MAGLSGLAPQKRKTDRSAVKGGNPTSPTLIIKQLRKIAAFLCLKVLTEVPIWFFLLLTLKVKY
jgi:hypothetical protein